MKPIPQKDLASILEPIFEQRIEESNLEGWTTSEFTIANVEEAYKHRICAAYVDDLEDPISCLVAAISRNPILPGSFAVANLIWVKPEVRRTRKALPLIKDLMESFFAYAKNNLCNVAVVSSWHYLGAEEEGIEDLWEKYEFDLLEKVFVKHLLA